MSELPFLSDLFIVAGVGVLAALLLSKLRLPAIAGFMLAGTVVGPHGLRLVSDAKLIATLADVGVVLLLFSIGLELSLSRLKRIARMVAVGGALQVSLTAVATLGVARALGYATPTGLFFGFMVALSSTAIVLRGLSERGEVDAPQGRFIVGALIFQDLCVIPMMLVLPILAGRATGNPWQSIAIAIAKAGALLLLTMIVGRTVIPRLFAQVDRLRSREAFLLTVLAVCIGASWATAQVGLSLALGAFLAGIVLSESEYAYRALGEVLPLRDVLSSLFFLSLGMLLDVSALVERPLAVLALFLAIFFGKGAIASLACLAMRFPPRIAVLSGAGLAQFGEFGFVLAQAGAGLGLLPREEGRVFLAASLLTMFVTPMSLRIAPHLAAGAKLLKPLERLLGARGVTEMPSTQPRLANHVIVAGLGVAGKLVTSALARTGVSHVAIDLNAEAVRAAAASNVPAYYGDITSEETLEHAGLMRARALVVLINDPEAARRAVLLATKLAPDLVIFARTKYLASPQELTGRPSINLIVEELESGVETLARVLRRADVPANIIKAEVRHARSQTQESTRVTSLPRRRLGEMAELDELKVESLVIANGAEAVGHTPAEIKLRTHSGALVVAVRRHGQLLAEAEELRFAAGDIAYLVGTRESIKRAQELLGV